eukprot:3480890-Rhodomonas_salina.1
MASRVRRKIGKTVHQYRTGTANTPPTPGTTRASSVPRTSYQICTVRASSISSQYRADTYHLAQYLGPRSSSTQLSTGHTVALA